MEQVFHSQSWYRVADLRVRLRRHARIYRTHYRGGLWYILQDRTSGRFHRFSPSSYRLISMMNGKRTLEEIWEIACDVLEDDTLTQDEVIRLLGQLHAADVLYGDIPPDIEEIAERGEHQRKRKFVMSFMNPLAVRLPVFDPDDFVTATYPLVRPFISWLGAMLFVSVVGYAVFLALSHWTELTKNVVDRILTAQNIGLIVLCYIVVKAIHELGHAYVVKRWGGDVHEIGVMFLVFMPVPYVDASDAMSFQSKWQRAMVGGAGILVEGFLAAIAMIVWVNAEDGFTRAFAFNTMLIGGISTLLFNGNPLLKFDGYYVLSDLIEIPNLAQRSKNYIGYLIKRYAFGMDQTQSPAVSRGEPTWFVVYAIAAFIYRIFITFAIVLFVSTQFFFLGIVLAIWALVLMFGWPLLKHIWFVLTNPGLRRHRSRAFAVTGGGIAAICVLLFAIPVSHATMAEGVVWVAGEQVVHSEADGIITSVGVQSGDMVQRGSALVTLDDPLAVARVRLLDGFIEELNHRLSAQSFMDRSAARIIQEELRAARGDRELTEERLDDLTIRASVAGSVILPGGQDLVGRFMHRGDVVAYVTDYTNPLIRVIVPEDRSDLVRSETRQLSVRFASNPDKTFPARVDREIPALSASLPSMALATDGGGRIALDPTAVGHKQALSKLLHLDVRISESTTFRHLGERVYVRFDHGKEPIARQIYRAGRQVFLRIFDI